MYRTLHSSLACVRPMPLHRSGGRNVTTLSYGFSSHDFLSHSSIPLFSRTAFSRTESRPSLSRTDSRRTDSRRTESRRTESRPSLSRTDSGSLFVGLFSRSTLTFNITIKAEVTSLTAGLAAKTHGSTPIHYSYELIMRV